MFKCLISAINFKSLFGIKTQLRPTHCDWLVCLLGTFDL